MQDASGATVSGTFSITLNAAPTLGTLSPSTWTANQSGYSGHIALSGGTGPFGNLTVTGVPAGLSASLRGNTITLSGTPTTAGTSNLHVSVVDAAGATASANYTVTISGPITVGTLAPNQWTVGQSGLSVK